MTDVMIDFETFGNGKDACVCQIGAVYFDRNSSEIGREFYHNVDARTAEKYGVKLDADTVYWWLNQDDRAVSSLMVKEITLPFDLAFHKLNGFLKGAEYIWSHASFDFVILKESLKLLNESPSFSHRACRDIRTLMDLAKLDPKTFERVGVHHNAFADAVHQANYVSVALRQIQRWHESVEPAFSR